MIVTDFFYPFRSKKTIVKDDNCCLCNLAGVKYSSKLAEDDILYANFRNRLYEVSRLSLLLLFFLQMCCIWPWIALMPFHSVFITEIVNSLTVNYIYLPFYLIGFQNFGRKFLKDYCFEYLFHINQNANCKIIKVLIDQQEVVKDWRQYILGF